MAVTPVWFDNIRTLHRFGRVAKRRNETVGTGRDEHWPGTLTTIDLQDAWKRILKLPLGKAIAMMHALLHIRCQGTPAGRADDYHSHNPSENV